MAWRPEAFTPTNIFDHTIAFAAQQFGEEHAEEIADIIKLYSKYARRVTPELLNAKHISSTMTSGLLSSGSGTTWSFVP